MPNNVISVVKEGLCLGCGVCKVACPFDAIKMAFDHARGSYYPIVALDSCTHCGVCLKVCFGTHIERIPSNEVELLGNHIECYLGFASDSDIRLRASSGGVVTAILNFLLDEKLIDGAIVTIMRRGRPYPRAEMFIAKDKKEVRAAMGSKYCPVLLTDVLRQLNMGGRYAFVGLPCHIYSVKKLAESDSRVKDAIKIYIGLLCGGGTPNYNGTLYLLKKYDIKNQYIKNIVYRGEGWPGCVLIETSSLSITIPHVVFWTLVSPYFHFDRCTYCLNGFNTYADLSCGDAWLPELMKKDKLGRSVLISRTKNGENVISEAQKKGYVALKKTDDNTCLETQRSMVEYKYFNLLPRVKVFKLFRKTAQIDLNKLNIKPNYRPRAYINELLVLASRFLASKENLWPLLDIYKITLKRIRKRQC